MTIARAVNEVARRTPRWTGRTRGGRLGNWFFITLVRWVGVRAAYMALIPVAAYFLLAAPGARRALLHFHRRLGHAGGWRGWWRVYRHFVAFGQTLLDRVAALTGQEHKYEVEIVGHDDLVQALAQNRGVIILSGHCGNWDVAAHKLRIFGRRVNVVAYRGEIEAIARMFDRLEAGMRPELIEADGSLDASLAILGALNRGEIVAMHGDRALGGMDTASVDFLGAPASFPTGPHLVAISARAPVVHAFAMRVRTFRYRLIARLAPPPTTAPDISRRDQVLASLRGYVAGLEREIRDFPLQWFNLYEFWDSLPQEKAA